MTAFLDNLHFLRPAWLWALLALPLLAGYWHVRRKRLHVWRDVVDPHLLSHLLAPGSGARGWLGIGLGLLAFALAILALAGPSWHKVSQPLWQTRAPLVIALDLSSATTATDLPPSRLLQARAKLRSLLEARQAGQVGLVAYAGAAFTVAPLTADAANVAVFLDALEPSIMPVDGQRTDLGIQWSAKLLRQAGFDRGQVLVLTDHADGAAHRAAADARAQGFRVSVLGLGNVAGAAYRNADGRIEHAQLDPASLRALAGAGGGDYAALTRDASDLATLGVLEAGRIAGQRGDERGQHWQDQGYWLLLPLLLLGALAFRRGGKVAVLALCLWLPVQSARASESFGLDDLWSRPDQQAHARMQQGTQAYRAGQFESAARAWQSLDSANAHYNRGNALAKSGSYQDAIAAYTAALQLQPDMADAQANKAAVEALLRQQQQQGGQGQSQQKGKQQDGQRKQQSGQQGKQQGNGQGKQQDHQQGQSGARDGQPADNRQDGAAREQEDDGRQDAPASSGDQQPPDSERDDTAPQNASDRQAQQAADAAQRQRMQRALQQARQAQAGDKDDTAAARVASQQTRQQRERELANQAWLLRVPDDPGGLLRRKFLLEYQRRQQAGED